MNIPGSFAFIGFCMAVVGYAGGYALARRWGWKTVYAAIAGVFAGIASAVLLIGLLTLMIFMSWANR